MPTCCTTRHLLLVVWGLAHGRGGIERLGTELSAFLVGRGHRVTVLIEDAGGAPPAFALDERVAIVRKSLIDTSSSRRCVRETLIRLNPDVCAAFFSWHVMLQWPALLRGTGIPLLLSERSNPHVIETERWNRADRLAALSGADRIHMQLESYKASLPPYLHERVCIIPNGVRLPANMPQRGNSPYNIMGMGRLIPSKQYHLLVEAFARLATEFAQWTLTIWGEGPERARLVSLVTAMGLHERIFFPGVTTDIDTAFSMASVFCHPSAQEGFPNAVLEAFAAGLPVIGLASCPGVNELILPETGILVQGHTPHSQVEALAQALHMLMRDHTLRIGMGRAAFDHAHTFDQRDLFNRWETLLLQCATRKGTTVLDHKLEDSPELMLRRRLDALLSLEQIHSSHPRLPRLPLDAFPVPGCDPADYPVAPEELPGPDMRLHTLPEMEACFIKVCIKLIQDSGLFDEAWYRKTYVRERPEIVPPIEHYLRLGAAAGYEPNPEFKTASYREHYMARHEDGLNPLVHAILYGKKQTQAQTSHGTD